jgi:hypothetical protein
VCTVQWTAVIVPSATPPKSRRHNPCDERQPIESFGQLTLTNEDPSRASGEEEVLADAPEVFRNA